jgi:hypothetical protein
MSVLPWFEMAPHSASTTRVNALVARLLTMRLAIAAKQAPQPG